MTQVTGRGLRQDHDLLSALGEPRIHPTRDATRDERDRLFELDEGGRTGTCCAPAGPTPRDITGPTPDPDVPSTEGEQ